MDNQNDNSAAVQAKAPPSYIIYLALFSVQVLFVLWFFVAKYAMAHVDLPPIIFAAYREAVATLVFLVMTKFSLSSSSSSSTGGSCSNAGFMSTILNVYRPHAWSFLLMGFLMFASVAGFIIGLSMVTSFNAAILQPTQPIFAMLIAWMFRLENMSRLKVLSIATACSGAIITVWISALSGNGGESDRLLRALNESGTNDDNLNPGLGNTILLFQCFFAGAMLVLQKRILLEVPSPLIVITITYTIASCLTALSAILSRGIHDPLLIVTSSVAWGAIAYAALFATVFTYYTTAWANNWANPSTVALSLCLQPLLTALFTAVSGGPKLVPPQALSCGLILAGLCIRVYDDNKKATTSHALDEDDNIDDENTIELKKNQITPLIQGQLSGTHQMSVTKTVSP